jgi:ribosome recycling factor
MLNDIKKNAQTRMAKSIDALKPPSPPSGPAAPRRPCWTRPVNAYGTRPAEPGCLDLQRRCPLAAGHAVRQEHDQGDREGSLQRRVDPEHRWAPRSASTCRRRPKSAARSWPSRCRRKARRQDRDPQHPPDANKEIAKLVKDKAISEDEEAPREDEIQKLTDKAIKDVDKVVDKEKNCCRSEVVHPASESAIATPAPATLPSSWMATGAGHSSAAPARDRPPCRRARSTHHRALP